MQVEERTHDQQVGEKKGFFVLGTMSHKGCMLCPVRVVSIQTVLVFDSGYGRVTTVAPS